MQFVISKAHV